MSPLLNDLNERLMALNKAALTTVGSDILRGVICCQIELIEYLAHLELTGENAEGV